MNSVAEKTPITESDAGTPVRSCRQLIGGDLQAWAKAWLADEHASGRIRRVDSVRLIWNQSGLRATLLYRLSHAIWRMRIPALPGILARLNLILYGFDVPPSIEIGPGLYVPHPVGMVIMATRIGANASLISNITIGMRNGPGFPTIGDNVFIGAGARVLGRIMIGDNVSIGANAVVLTDVPSGATAVGVPAKLVHRKPSEDGDNSDKVDGIRNVV